MANLNLYDLRNRCPFYHISPADQEKTELDNPKTEVAEAPHSSIKTASDQVDSIEVMLHKHFYNKILQDLGIKRLADLPDEIQKMDDFWASIGALISVKDASDG